MTDLLPQFHPWIGGEIKGAIWSCCRRNASLKVISSAEFSPALLRELRRPSQQKKKAKAAAPSKVKTSCVALIKHRATVSGAGSEAQSYRKASQHIACKINPEELSNSDGLTVPATRRTAQDPLDGSAILGNSGEPTAESSPQLHVTEGRPAYAAEVARRTTLNSQLDRARTKLMIRTLPNLLPPLRQPSGACLAKTCPGLWAACQLALFRITSSPQEIDVIKHAF